MNNARGPETSSDDSVRLADATVAGGASSARLIAGLRVKRQLAPVPRTSTGYERPQRHGSCVERVEMYSHQRICRGGLASEHLDAGFREQSLESRVECGGQGRRWSCDHYRSRESRVS